MSKAVTAVTPRFRPIQRLQLMTLPRDDPYQPKRKPHEPGVCEDCGVLWSHGRWHWGAAPPDAQRLVCPACRRIRERAPAGYVRISGPALSTRRAEIDGLLRNHEARERQTHPLQRILAIEEQAAQLTVTTTDLHLARGLGDALHAALRGTLDYHYNDAEHLLYVDWHG